MGVVEEAVEESGGHSGVAGKDLGPVFEGDVGGDEDRAGLVAFADDLEEEFGSAFVQGEIAKLVDCQERWGEIALHFAVELSSGLGGAEAVDDVDCRGKEDALSLEAGGVADGDREVCFSDPRRACKD